MIINEVFNSDDDLVDWAQNIARSLGFVIVKRRTKKKNGYLFKIQLMCSKSREYHSQRLECEIQRNTGSAKTDCPFELVAKYYKRHDFWTLTVVCDEHNHPYASTLEGHPYAARFNEDEFLLVKELTSYNVQPRHILSTIKEHNPNNVSSLRNVYNAQNKIRGVIRGDRTPVQVLLSHLKGKGYVYYERVNELTNKLEELFFVHPTSYAIWCTFPHIMIMDSTYNTTLFKLLFFEIVGFTSTNKTFSMGFSFLDKEKGPNFRWVLQCVKKVLVEAYYPRVIITDRDLALMGACKEEFPNAKKLLCRWHISQNMFKYCRGRLQTYSLWESVKYTWEHMINAPTRRLLMEYYTHLQELLVAHPDVSLYLDDWLKNYKDMFVSVLTDKYLNYGESTSCRVESQHALVKKYLGGAQSNLDTLLSSIDKVITGQETAIKESFNKTKNVRQHRFKIPQFSLLVDCVSHHALDKILKELQRPNNEECGCQLRTSYGLPCAHELLYYHNNGLYIPLECIDIFWRTLDHPWPVMFEDGASCEAEMKKFKNVFEKASPFVKINYLTKLKAITTPEGVSVREPEVHINTRGHPSAKDKKKQKAQFVQHVNPLRQQSNHFVPPYQSNHFVPPYVDPHRRSYSTYTNVPDLNQEPARHSSYVQESARHGSYIEQPSESDILTSHIPLIFRPHITSMYNVLGDGNCGFRSVAIGIGQSESTWPEIRQNLLQELDQHEILYTAMWGNDGFRNIRFTVDHFEPGFAPRVKWMSMPNTGCVIATYYNRSVIFISQQQCWTCFPLLYGPNWSQRTDPIVIPLVGGEHFINVTLDESCPLLSTHPQWRMYKKGEASEWADIYSARQM